MKRKISYALIVLLLSSACCFVSSCSSNRSEEGYMMHHKTYKNHKVRQNIKVKGYGDYGNTNKRR
ncbi:MAG: hypothetical protein LBL74_03840 [Bacteroidales bacterium]|jgi:hypothetical protein|nr:hypothetical protein [Bacteroidales bacterium]